MKRKVRRATPQRTTPSASFAPSLRSLRLIFTIPVTPAQAGIQGHKHQSRLPPWTPDHVRGEETCPC